MLSYRWMRAWSYTPGDAVGILPENRAEAVAEVLKALGFTGDERVLDHYKVEISFEEAVRTRLSIGKLARGSVNQFAKLAPDNEKLKLMTGPEHKAQAEEYVWGREFIDLVKEFPGIVSEPQQLFNILSRADAEDVLDRVEPGAAWSRTCRRRCAWGAV